MTQPSPGSAASRPGRAVVVAHAVVFLALAAWSWRKWPDPLVDFGRELYVPWQITRGKVLYRDIASLFGPLSPYVNALWFRLFGRSLMTLAAVNFAIFAAMIAGVYHLLQVSTNRVAAGFATVTCVLLFGFSQYLDVGNYNFITPYSHEATHGLALSVATIVALVHAVSRRSAWLGGLAGACCGLVFLTKPEIALALAAAVMIGFGAAIRVSGTAASLRTVAPFVAGACVGPAAFLIYFMTLARLPAADAVHALVAGWIPAFATPVAKNPFYARITGFDYPVRNALHVAEVSVGGLLMGAAAVGLARIPLSNLRLRAVAIFSQVGFVLIVAYAVPRFELSRALPLIAVAGLAAAGVGFSRARRDDEALRLLPLLMWSAFAVAMLAKMLLNAQFYHYGFYLALPATSIAVVVALWLVPRIARATFGEAPAQRARWLLAAAAVVSTMPYLALSQIWFETKTLAVGSDGDRFLASDGPKLWQGKAVRDAVEWLNRHAAQDATVVVLPEGVMINYLSRRETPLRFVNFMPPEVITFREEAILSAFEAHPPDFVLVVDRSTFEYGYASFGSDPRYGRTTLSWIERHYTPVAHIARNPAGGAGPAMTVLQRKPRELRE